MLQVLSLNTLENYWHHSLRASVDSVWSSPTVILTRFPDLSRYQAPPCANDNNRSCLSLSIGYRLLHEQTLSSWRSVYECCQMSISELSSRDFVTAASHINTLQTSCLFIFYSYFHPSRVFLTYEFSSPKGYTMFIFPFCGCKKQHGQSNSGEGKVYSSLQFQVTLYHWGKLGQELKKGLRQKPWRNAACLLTLWLFLFIPPSQTMLPGTMHWVLLHQVTIKIVPHRHAHRPRWSWQLVTEASLYRWF